MDQVVTEYLSTNWITVNRVKINNFYYYAVHKHGFKSFYSNNMEYAIKMNPALTDHEKQWLFEYFGPEISKLIYATKQ